jgi:hypothetical protein
MPALQRLMATGKTCPALPGLAFGIYELNHVFFYLTGDADASGSSRANLRYTHLGTA